MDTPIELAAVKGHYLIVPQSFLNKGMCVRQQGVFATVPPPTLDQDSDGDFSNGDFSDEDFDAVVSPEDGDMYTREQGRATVFEVMQAMPSNKHLRELCTSLVYG